MSRSLLIVEDADTLRDVLASVLESEGYETVAVASAEAAMEEFKKQKFDCVLSDFRLPEKNGVELLQFVREIDREVPYLIMTAFGTIDIAVEAMRLGANDFITKPFEPEDLKEKLEQVISHRQILNRSLGKETRRGRKFSTHDETTKRMLEQAKKAARVDTTVFLLGESGTGKELIARYVHDNSMRHDKPFVAVNCAAMPAELLESEFFGHEAGAFTGATQTRVGVLELASDGTIFLDEVGDMPPQLQVKLLRALQEREIKRVGGNKTIKINPRIVAATNIDIEEAMESGKLREDFYYRLAVITLEVPPLRERPDDVLPLATYFMEYFASHSGKESMKLSKEATNLLTRYPWPGNVRELENVMERATLLAEEIISPEHLGISLQLDYGALHDAACTLPEIAAQATRKAEMEVIGKALKQTRGNKSQAAKILGVSYKTLLNKIRDYGLGAEESEASDQLSGFESTL
ncbi:MAG: sigma-54-dependent Fis family transcriptional regulator [Bdellovibrionales bacterium]|nr:sigma-54-dependent Fis family transcriptional regulator [Bdellovibrionales bacterium]